MLKFALQPLRRSLLFTTAIRPIQRSFSVAGPRWASELPKPAFGDSHYEAPSAQGLFDRLQQSPQILAAITTLTSLCKAKAGVDLSNGDRPTLKLMQMMTQCVGLVVVVHGRPRLTHWGFPSYRDSELQAAAAELMLALKDSQIEIDPAQAFEALKQMGGDGFGEDDTGFGREGEFDVDDDDGEDKKGSK